MKEFDSNNSRDIFGLVIMVGAVALAFGCGDASAGAADEESLCAAMCAHGDACPNLYAEADCVSECEAAREQAAALGGTCAYALEDFVECYGNLSCEDLGARVQNPNSVDACTPAEQAAVNCEPWTSDDSPEPLEPEMDEVRLACQSFCARNADCGIEFESDCESVCLMSYAPYQAHSPACAATFVDAFSCYSNMQCSELVHRINETSRIDSCTVIDDQAISACAPE